MSYQIGYQIQVGVEANWTVIGNQDLREGQELQWKIDDGTNWVHIAIIEQCLHMEF